MIANVKQIELTSRGGSHDYVDMLFFGWIFKDVRQLGGSA
jgi:hypothetical protein